MKLKTIFVFAFVLSAMIVAPLAPTGGAFAHGSHHGGHGHGGYGHHHGGHGHYHGGHGHHHDGRAGAAVAGAIIGIGVGAAIANSQNRNNVCQSPNYPGRC